MVSAGPKQVVSWNYGSIYKPANKFLDYGLQLFSPSAPGNYSVVVFLLGLDGNVPGFTYQHFSEILTANSERILIIFNKLGFVNTPEKEDIKFEKSLNWTLENIQYIFNSEDTPTSIKNQVKPDLATNGVTLMSHSSSGHLVSLYLNRTCGLVKKLILLDPVDGSDPFGLDKSFVVHPPQKLPFQIPTLFGTSGLGDVSILAPLPSCTPPKLSNMRFYDAMTGPRFYMNFTEYGHADFLDDWVIKCCAGLVCKTCTKDCKFDLYRESIAKTISYFIKGIDEKNAMYLRALESPNNSTMFNPEIKVTSFFDYNGFDVLKTGPFCINNKQQN